MSKILQAFGQRRIQPLLMRLAADDRTRSVVAQLMPLVTIPDCSRCPALEHCMNACLGFRNLCLKAGVVNEH